MSDGTATVENSLADPQMIVTQSYHGTQQSQSWVYPKRKEQACPHKNVYTSAHRSITHNSQEVDTTQKSITGTSTVWSDHAVEYYSTSEWNAALKHRTWASLRKRGGRRHKDQALCDSDHMKCPGQMNLHRQIMVA